MAPPLVIVGGTFDPPHIGHLVLAECARTQLGADFAVFLPAGDPWRKTASVPGPNPLPARAVSPAIHRLAMIQLAIRDNPAFHLDDREVRRDRPTFTVDTLRELHAEGQRNLVFVIGSDALADLPNWQEPEAIEQLARLAIARKPGSNPVTAGERIRVDMPALGVSSTEIRERIRRHRTVRYLLPAAVEAYIAEHGLYRDTPETGARW